MIRTLVVYYSNTGNTEKVARQLARRLDADLAAVSCPTYARWYGPFAMAWDIFTRHLPSVDVLVPPGASYERVVLGGPVWGAHAAPPILALADHPVLKAGRTAFFVTCRGNSPKSPPKPALEEMQKMVEGPSLGSWIFTAHELAPEPLVAATEQFAHAMEANAAAQPPL